MELNRTQDIVVAVAFWLQHVAAAIRLGNLVVFIKKRGFLTWRGC